MLWNWRAPILQFCYFPNCFVYPLWSIGILRSPFQFLTQKVCWDLWKDWGQEEKGTTEDEMVGWHHWLDGHEFEWAPGVGDGQGGLACCDSWGRKESDMTERLNWIEHMFLLLLSFFSSESSKVRCHWEFGNIKACHPSKIKRVF